jgi:hypothetical protein
VEDRFVRKRHSDHSICTRSHSHRKHHKKLGKEQDLTASKSSAESSFDRLRTDSARKTRLPRLKYNQRFILGIVALRGFVGNLPIVLPDIKRSAGS